MTKASPTRPNPTAQCRRFTRKASASQGLGAYCLSKSRWWNLGHLSTQTLVISHIESRGEISTIQPQNQIKLEIQRPTLEPMTGRIRCIIHAIIRLARLSPSINTENYNMCLITNAKETVTGSNEVPSLALSSVSSFSSTDSESNGLKVLICSENVPPQVNGIARRIGMYADGLTDMGCDVDVLHPDSGTAKVLSHVNPWNFTARMMIINPFHLFKLLMTPYDVVHVVMPANISCMWVLAAFKIYRCLTRQSKPALVVSWHCNIVDYLQHFSMGPLRFVAYACFFLLFGMLPMISDRVLTPTKKSEPMLVRLWKREVGRRAGVCYTGVNKTEFSPDAKESEWGRNWANSKEKYLAKVNKKFLIICVGRLSPEKGVDELIKVLPRLKDCALWLVGDGPHRPHLEQLARDLKVPVQFLGYQSGDALHSVYCQADLFVCPSLTETFGQTVNEALASQVRVALPNVPVFAEAYGAAIPSDAFWKPLDQADMARAISRQLQRHAKNDSDGIPNLDKLKSWPDACEALLQEYHEAFQDRQHTFTTFCWVYFPIWWTFSAMTIISFFVFSQVRSFCGGSVRLFFRSSAESMLIKVASLQRLPSANSLQRMEKGQKLSVH